MSHSDPSMRFHINDVINHLCDLDEQYEDLIHDGITSGPHNDYIIEKIEELEEALWDLPIGREDLEWLANRPITGTNRIGDPYYSQTPGELGTRDYERA